MTQQERNIEIVKMLGKELRHEEDSITIWSDNKKSSYGLLYHSSWEMLMKAVDFIQTKTELNIYKQYCTIAIEINSKYLKSFGTSTKDAVFTAVSNFTKLYNEGKL